MSDRVLYVWRKLDMKTTLSILVSGEIFVIFIYLHIIIYAYIGMSTDSYFEQFQENFHWVENQSILYVCIQ